MGSIEPAHGRRAATLSPWRAHAPACRTCGLAESARLLRVAYESRGRVLLWSPEPRERRRRRAAVCRAAVGVQRLHAGESPRRGVMLSMWRPAQLPSRTLTGYTCPIGAAATRCCLSGPPRIPWHARAGAATRHHHTSSRSDLCASCTAHHQRTVPAKDIGRVCAERHECPWTGDAPCDGTTERRDPA